MELAKLRDGTTAMHLGAKADHYDVRRQLPPRRRVCSARPSSTWLGRAARRDQTPQVCQTIVSHSNLGEQLLNALDDARCTPLDYCSIAARPRFERLRGFCRSGCDRRNAQPRGPSSHGRL